MERILKIINAEGSTPLENLDGLIPRHFTVQRELNEWEAQNIKEAQIWAYMKRKTKSILTLSFLRNLHFRMFNHTWKWAGEWRTSQTNIECNYGHIPQELLHLLEDVRYQLENKIYTVQESAMRFHHRLVLIHPFANGNGRHSRLMTDILCFDHGIQLFKWGGTDLTKSDNVRKQYLSALRAADNHDYAKLADFLEINNQK
jgi:Fic-DOC domain mobile mystery protein B